MMNLQNTEPKIRIRGASSVTVDPISSIRDLADVTRKFGRIVAADLPGAALKLTTATGDLVASVQQGDTREGFAEEVADVVIAAFVVASQFGLSADDIKPALQERLRDQASKAIAASVTELLQSRGFAD